MTFDTLQYAKRLKAVGFTEEQAETLATEQAALVDETLVTKRYLDQRVQELEYRLTIRLGAMLVTAVGAVAVLVKIL